MRNATCARDLYGSLFYDLTHKFRSFRGGLTVCHAGSLYYGRYRESGDIGNRVKLDS